MKIVEQPTVEPVRMECPLDRRNRESHLVSIPSGRCTGYDDEKLRKVWLWRRFVVRKFVVRWSSFVNRGLPMADTALPPAEPRIPDHGL
jgi:hypothetical protein